MTPISIPQHLLIPTLISLVLFLLILIRIKRIFKNSKRKSIWIGVITFLIIYIIILCSAIYDDIYCQWDLNKYDLNMNGIFESNEINSAQQAAYQRLINDTGRNFAVFTGLIFSGLISLVVFLVGFGFEKYKRLKTK
jgi:glucan phosphoethanolaminetransferase (alkaline phosphatase superfamily)